MRRNWGIVVPDLATESAPMCRNHEAICMPEGLWQVSHREARKSPDLCNARDCYGLESPGIHEFT